MATLILGGTGFIGARLADRLVSRGEKVICLDLYPNFGRVSHLGDGVKIVEGDITRIEDIIDPIREFQIERIFNLAYMLGEKNETNLQLSARVNVMGMNNVFEAARLTGVDRIVYTSSIAVYGLQDSFGERPVTESDLCQPVLVYGAEKLFNEFMAGKYIERYGLKIAGLRLPAVCGPGRTTGGSIWGSTYADLPAVDKPVDIPLRSNQRTLAIYVDDAADILMRLCFAKKLKYSIYNSVSYSITLQELAEAVRGLLPKAEIGFNEEAPDQPLVYNCSSERLEKEFQFKIKPLEEMVKNHINRVRRKSGLSEI